jgi:iron complex outermembrane recepter protein
MSFRKPLRAMAPSVWAFCATVPAILFAADAGAAEPTQTSAGVIEEIVVTSRREEESIQDVPVSVSAFTQQDLQRISPYNLTDMDGLMPNVSIQQQTAGPGMGAIFIRGIGSADVEKTTPPQVGVVIDGLFQPTNTGQIIDMFDIDQVEVNRGPQGVLYGKNTTGGTIVVHRSQPQFNELNYKVSAEGGTYNEELYKGRVNIPLIDDKLALKVAAASNQRDGVYQNTTRQTDDANVDYKTYNLALKWAATDQITATMWYDNIDDTGNYGVPNDPYVDGKQPWKTQANLKQPVKYNVDEWGLNVQWDLGGATLESITGYVDSKDIVQQDFDNSTLATVAIPLPQLHTLRNQDMSVTSEELRLSGELVKNVNYTVGALYYNTSLDFRQGTNQVLQLPYGTGGFGLPAGFTCETFGLHSNPIPQVGSALCQTDGIGSYQKTNQQDLSKALYGALNYQVTDRLQLSAGMRRIQQDISFKGAFYDAAIPPGSIDPPHGASSATALPPFPINSSNDWNKTIMEGSATFNITDTNMVYARYSQGFRSGGFSNRGNDPRYLSFAPETADAYEIGTKNEFFDRKLQLNLTGFYTIQHDIQFGSILTTNGVPPGTNTIVNNGGDVDEYGFELQSTWLINDLFSIIATYGYQDNNVDKFQISSEKVPFTPDGSGCDPLTFGGPCPSVTLGGEGLGRAPKYNYSVQGVYTQSFGPYDVSVAVIGRGQDDMVLVGGATAAAVVTQKAYSLIDMRAAVQWNMGNGNLLRLSLIGKNLDDKEYITEALPLGNGGFEGWGTPRTWGLELLYQH